MGGGWGVGCKGLKGQRAFGVKQGLDDKKVCLIVGRGAGRRPAPRNTREASDDKMGVRGGSQRLPEPPRGLIGTLTGRRLSGDRKKSILEGRC